MRRFRAISHEAARLSPSYSARAQKANAPLRFTFYTLSITCKQGSGEPLSQQNGRGYHVRDWEHSSSFGEGQEEGEH